MGKIVAWKWVNLGCKDTISDIPCTRNRLGTVPLVISTKLNKIKSTSHLNLMINFASCSIYEPKLRIGTWLSGKKVIELGLFVSQWTIIGSWWAHCLRHGSAAACLIVFRVRIPPGAQLFVFCESCLCSGTGLWDGPIPRPEESHRVCVSLSMMRYTNNPVHLPQVGRRCHSKKERKKEKKERKKELYLD